jgi:hypothetical protein
VSWASTVGRLLYLDILDYIVIPLTLLIMAVGFTAWVAHIYSVRFETSCIILFGVANLSCPFCITVSYDPIGTVKQKSWADELVGFTLDVAFVSCTFVYIYIDEFADTLTVQPERFQISAS